MTGNRLLSWWQRELDIDEVHAELLPQDKVSQVEALLSKETEKERLAFVGDGINDAPVLSRADIGIAMGSMGSDAAIEAADVVLMDDDIRKIASVVRTLPQDADHRSPEHRLRPGRQGTGAHPRRPGHGQHVGSRVRRCRCIRYRYPQLHAGVKDRVR